jgi:hypothetical protein
LIATFALVGYGMIGTARAAPPPGLADLLARDPIQVTDHAPRALPADRA